MISISLSDQFGNTIDLLNTVHINLEVKGLDRDLLFQYSRNGFLRELIMNLSIPEPFGTRLQEEILKSLDDI